MRNRLRLATGLRLPPTMVFDYPTSVAVAGYLFDEIEAGERVTADGELERLELALKALPVEDPGRAGLATHLRALAADLEGAGRAAARAATWTGSNRHPTRSCSISSTNRWCPLIATERAMRPPTDWRSPRG